VDLLTERAREALGRRDGARALQLLGELEPRLGARAPPQFHLDQALALRMLGRDEEALLGIERALVLEPTHFIALLSKGSVLAGLGRDQRAAEAYRAAIAVAPPQTALPPSLASALEGARRAVDEANRRLADHLKSSVAQARSAFPGADLDRFDESLEIYAGIKQPFVQKPLLLHYPRLPAIPFYDRDLFPWLAELEAASEIISEEMAQARACAFDAFTPYVKFPPGVPVNQWRDLNHSAKWTTYYLWLNGLRQEQACALCPRTAEVLSRLPMADQTGHAPTAMFSVLDARTAIPPHTGSTNTRLVVHLPLDLPGPAWFRVGNVRRDWRMGQAWVFDDTIEHEAMNEADAPRTILIFDVWNPFLSEAERALVSAMMSARRAWEGEG
jgi:aspartyl/asparaginyl beta-hydroxylase (cupin superfamily)